ncbi:hypothetical protein Baya_7565 [Bagarius yarrelli]|uniref:Uncharacterized protein n=1 Tax=Bagarius yarrelli TaxID=175774 RepID=A0A556U252_BAGYA|nr:hypothetical protein Baya_7565 [Bagarius yarrelli]
MDVSQRYWYRQSVCKGLEGLAFFWPQPMNLSLAICCVIFTLKPLPGAASVAVLDDMVAEVTRALDAAKCPILVSSVHAFPAVLWLYCDSQCTEVRAVRVAECHSC